MRMNPDSIPSRRDSSGRPPRTRARAALRGELVEVVRRAILEAAEAVLGASGLAEAKMAEIAERAGLAAGTLYNYFPSKESLFCALIEHRGEEFLRRLEDIDRGPAAPLVALERLTQVTLDYIESHAAMFDMFAQAGERAGWTACSALAGRLQQRYLALYERRLAQAEKARMVRSGMAPAELAQTFTGSVQGFVRRWLLCGRKGRLAERAPFLVDLFLHGAGVRR
jgi:AcrR family transcriptional regulator